MHTQPEHGNHARCHAAAASRQGPFAHATLCVRHTCTHVRLRVSHTCAPRSVYCASNPGGQQLADSFCTTTSGTGRAAINIPMPKPSATQACTLPTCVSYSFSIGQWGGCSVSCGSGFQTRAVTCITSPGNQQVSDSLCTGSGRAATVKPSSTQACARPTCISYQYLTGVWGGCSVTCGGGIQTRQVNCASQPGNAQVADSTCSSAGIPKPSAAQSCTLPTCIVYSYVSAAWGACSVSCGSGLQIRQVYCAGQPGNLQVSDSFCDVSSAIVRPSTNQPCILPTCISYAYVPGQWGACSVSCGSGTVTRTASCIGTPGGQTVPDALCSASARSVLVQACLRPVCISYSYSAGQWGTCSVTCGSGLQLRPVVCTATPPGVEVPSALCASAGAPPSGTQACTLPTCTT